MSSNLIVNNIEVGAGATIYTAASNQLAFGTNGSEKVRITSSGQLLVKGTSVIGSGTGLEVTYAGSSAHGRVLAQGFIARDNYGSHTDIGNGMYSPASNSLSFATNSLERLRIASDGDVIIGGTDAGYPNFADNLTIHDTQHSGITIRSGIASQGAIYFSDATGSGTGTYVGNIIYDHSDNHMRFATSGTERVRITSGGKVGMGLVDSGGTGCDPDGNTLLIRAASTVGTTKGHIMLTGDGATNGEGPQIVFSESGGGSSYAGAYIGHIRATTNSVGHLVFGTRESGGDANTVPTERLRITHEGKVGIGTINPSGSLGVWDASGSDPTMSLHHSNADVEGEIIRIGRTDLPIIRYHSIKSKHGGAATANYIAFNLHNGSGTTNQTEVLRIVGNGEITTSGTTKIKPHSVGIGTTATTNTGVGTAYGEMMYNTTDDKLQIYTKSNKWYNVHNWTDSVEGYYKSITAASADGLNHYWPGNSSQSLISSLTPSGSPDGSPEAPVVNLTSDSYHGSYPYFNFYSGTNELGWMFLKSGTKWGNGPFTIAFWVRPQASNLESESTFVQLGSHSGTRSLYTVSTDGSRKLKAITIGDDTGVHSSATLSTSWQHVVVTYETNRNTKYYINGSNVRTFNHSGNLDVGTSSQYIYIGYGYWNSTDSNKACMSQMSDIGIWDSDALTATEISNLYNAKRIIAGY